MFTNLSLKAKLAIVNVILVSLFVLGQPGVAGAMASPTGPRTPIVTAATSFSVDSTTMLDTAASIFNALWPIFGLVVGIILGIGLVTLLVSEIRKAI
jgi:hypothetical protein